MKMTVHTTTRSLLAGAALAACGAAQAQSNVTLYGIVSQDAIRATNTASGVRYMLENGRLNASRLGFKGYEDLGGGLAAIFGLESGINPDTGAANGGPGAFFNRGSYVGFKGGFGTLTFGRQWNVNDDLLGNFFIFGGYAVFSYNGFGKTSDLYDNSAKYVSPSFAGFTFEALGALGEGKPRSAEAALSYNAGPLKAALTYAQTENKSTGLKDKLASGGISYGMGTWNLRAGYSSANNQLSGVGVPGFPKAAAYDVGVDYKLTPLAVINVDYVAKDVKDSSDDAHFIRLLLQYNLSKRTQLNANIVSLKNKGSAMESFYGINGPGKTQNVYALGMSHSF